MKMILLMSLLFTSSVYAAKCAKQVTELFKQENPRFIINSVKYEGVLKAGEEKPYLQAEIWNSGRTPLEIYRIDSSFMAGFTHVALVSATTCRVANLIEVDFR